MCESIAACARAGRFGRFVFTEAYFSLRNARARNATGSRVTVGVLPTGIAVRLRAPAQPGAKFGDAFDSKYVTSAGRSRKRSLYNMWRRCGLGRKSAAGNAQVVNEKLGQATRSDRQGIL